MDFQTYQEKARGTAKYPEAGDNFMYPGLGLMGEAGEVADKLKKLMRDQGIFKPSQTSDEFRADLKKELGDVLWYVAQLSSEFGLSMEEVAVGNIDKLYSRLNRGVLGGNGDNR